MLSVYNFELSHAPAELLFSTLDDQIPDSRFIDTSRELVGFDTKSRKIATFGSDRGDMLHRIQTESAGSSRLPENERSSLDCEADPLDLVAA
jgi:hypothetical protein